MLTLHHGPNTVVTDESFSVKLKWVNPCCFHDAIPGDVGLGIEISVNEYTRAEYGNPHRFEKFSTANDRKFPNHAIRKNGVSLITGTLVITNATAQTYSGWLQSEVGVLGAKQRDKFITEMPWKTGVPFVNKPLYDSAIGDEYALIQIENQTFWDGHGPEITETFSYTDADDNPQTTEMQINALTKEFRDNHDYLVNRELGGFPVTGYADSGLGCVISPYLFLGYVVKQMLQMNGFYVDPANDAMSDEDFKFVVYNNFNIWRQTFTITSNMYWVWNDPGPGGRYIIVREAVTAWEISNFDYASLLPRIAMKDFILGVQNYLNIVFHFRNDNSVVLVNRNNVINADPYDLDPYFMGSWILGEQKDVTLKFSPDYDKNDDLFANEWHDLSERRADFGEMVETLAQLEALVGPQLGELRLVRGEGKIYEYKWHVYPVVDVNYGEVQKEVLQWVVASPIPQPYFHGTADEVEEIKIPCSTLSSDSYYSKPKAKQQGNLASDRSIWSNFSFRLLDNAGYYPPSLAFDGEYGLFATHWKNWATFWKTRLPVEGEFMLPLNVLQYVINNITQPYRTREGKFIIEEIECDFKGELMGLVRVKGYKI